MAASEVSTVADCDSMVGKSSATSTPSWWERAGSLWVSFRDRTEEKFAKRQPERKQRPQGAHHLIAGTSAGVVTTVALFPLDLVKTRYQARRHKGTLMIASSKFFIVPFNFAGGTARYAVG